METVNALTHKRKNWSSGGLCIKGIHVRNEFQNYSAVLLLCILFYS